MPCNSAGPWGGRRPDTTVPAPGAGAGTVVGGAYAGRIFSAWGPFWPCVTSKVTFWPS